MEVPGDPINIQLRPSLMSRRSIDPSSKYPDRESMKEVTQLVKNIKELNLKNKMVYQEITKKDAKFTFTLYKPQIPHRIISEQIKIIQQKLLRQLDKLYEQNSDLTKELNKLHFRQQNQELLKDQSICKNMNHYQFLRTTWKKQTIQKQKQNTEDQLQRLTQNVALIRGHINLTIKKQSLAYQNLSKQIEKKFPFNQNSKKYENLLKKYEQLQMSFQDRISTKINEQNKNKQTEFSYNTHNEKIQAQLSHNKIKIQQLQQKVKDLEYRLLKSQSQVFCLNDKLNQKQQLLAQIRKQNQTRRVCIFQSFENVVDTQEPLYQIKIFSKQLFADHLNQKTIIYSSLSQIMNFFKEKTKLNLNEVQKDNAIQQLPRLPLQEISLKQPLNNSTRKSLNSSFQNKNLNKIVYTQRYSIPRKSNFLIGESFSKKEKESIHVNHKISEDFLIQMPTDLGLDKINNKENLNKKELKQQVLKSDESFFPQQKQNSSSTFSQMKFIRTNTNGRGRRRDSIR